MASLQVDTVQEISLPILNHNLIGLHPGTFSTRIWHLIVENIFSPLDYDPYRELDDHRKLLVELSNGEKKDVRVTFDWLRDNSVNVSIDGIILFWDVDNYPLFENF